MEGGLDQVETGASCRFIKEELLHVDADIHRADNGGTAQSKLYVVRPRGRRCEQIDAEIDGPAGGYVFREIIALGLGHFARVVYGY